MADILSYVIIGIAIALVGTAIYIGHILYKRREKEDFKDGGKIRERELELGPLPDETKKFAQESIEITSKDSKYSQSSLENSSITLYSQEKERKSPSPKTNSKRNSKSHNKIVKSSRLSRNASMNVRYSSMSGSRYSSMNDSRYDSIIDSGKSSINDLRKESMDSSRKGSINGSRKGSINGSRKGSVKYSRSDSRINSLAINIPNEINEIPPPPPPSPLKSRDDRAESFLNIMPSDITDSTYTAHMASKTSSPILSRSQSKSELKSQPPSQVDLSQIGCFEV